MSNTSTTADGGITIYDVPNLGLVVLAHEHNKTCAQLRRERDHAQEELMQLINEARRLHLHLQAWENYV